MEKRAQSSTEYLVILAVVVIIALAVVGVLGGFPTLTKGVSTKDSLAYWQSGEVGVEKPYLSTSTNSTLVLRNNQNFGITITGVFFNNAPAQNGTNSNLPATLSPGQTVTVLMTANSTNPCIGTTAGSATFSPIVKLTYYDTSANANTYQFTGAKPLVGTCQ
ncbi:MAG: hypothetical protein V1820_04750 [archaeon]